MRHVMIGFVCQNRGRMTIDIVSASVLSYSVTQNIKGSVYNTWKMRIQYEKDMTN